jgi:NAD(P)H dehydrogenase (quinone)
MKRLIIIAHPSVKSYSHRLASSIKQATIDSEGEVDVLDLYREPRQDYLVYEDMRQPLPDDRRQALQQRIVAADELVFIFPLWWCGMPAIMKNFIDSNFLSGFAYRFEKGLPVGLLKPRTARVYITCDGSAWFYRLILMPFRTIINLCTLRFCGFGIKSFNLYDRVRLRDEIVRRRWLDKVYKSIRKTHDKK